MGNFISEKVEFLYSFSKFLFIIDICILVLMIIVFVLNDKNKFIKLRDASKVAKNFVYTMLVVLVIAIVFFGLATIINAILS